MSARRALRAPPFEPLPWLRNPHAQTVVGRLLRSGLRSEYRRRRIETPDGDFLDLDTLAPSPSAPGSPVCLLLHGLEGSSSSGYIVRTARLLAGSGVRPVVLNFRSCGGEPNRRLRSYHSGETGDIALAARWIREEFAPRAVGAIGYSLGGNALLLRLAEPDVEKDFAAAAALSVPFDLAAGARRLEAGMGRVYAYGFLRSLRRKIREKGDRFPRAAALARDALRARTIRGVDEAWTAPVHGFRDADHYYETCSSLRRLDRVRVRTLIVHARDDPFLPPETPAALERVVNDRTELDLTHFGGHLGYVDRRSGSRLWAEARAVAWMIPRLRERIEGE